jgi:hypothetical protein
MGEQPVFISSKPQPHDKELEADDPYELTGVRYPVADGVDADRETARTVIEEFAMQGWSRQKIGALFAQPQAGHAYDIYRRRGDALLDELFDLVFISSQGAS